MERKEFAKQINKELKKLDEKPTIKEIRDALIGLGKLKKQDYKLFNKMTTNLKGWHHLISSPIATLMLGVDSDITERIFYDRNGEKIATLKIVPKKVDEFKKAAAKIAKMR